MIVVYVDRVERAYKLDLIKKCVNELNNLVSEFTEVSALDHEILVKNISGYNDEILKLL